jgi:hypothetical protein
MHKPTDTTKEQVQMLATIGTPQEVIARVIGIDRGTLAKHYADELELSKSKADARVALSLYQNAINGNVAAQIFWCKTRLGWKETQVLEQRQFAVLVEGPELTEEEWLTESLGSHKPDRKPH